MSPESRSPSCGRRSARPCETCPTRWRRATVPSYRSIPVWLIVPIVLRASHFLYLHGAPELRVFQALGLLPGIDHAMDHRQVRENGDHPEHGGHAVEQRADYDQHDSLGTLQEADFALGNRALGTRPD